MLEATLDLDEVFQLRGVPSTAKVVFHPTLVVLDILPVLAVVLQLVVIDRRSRQLFERFQVNHMATANLCKVLIGVSQASMCYTR